MVVITLYDAFIRNQWDHHAVQGHVSVISSTGTHVLHVATHLLPVVIQKLRLNYIKNNQSVQCYHIANAFSQTFIEETNVFHLHNLKVRNIIKCCVTLDNSTYEKVLVCHYCLHDTFDGYIL